MQNLLSKVWIQISGHLITQEYIMSTKHPVVAVTGSSGAGTTTVKDAFEHIFFRENINQD